MNRMIHQHRNALVIILLAILACAGPVMGKPIKFDRDKRLGFAEMVPAQLGDWKRISMKDSGELPEQLDINELYQALYEHPIHGLVALTLEYTSDSRREFELHYPDICHTIRGDEVSLLQPERLELASGQSIDAANMHWRHFNKNHSALAVYWYITREGVTIDSMQLKINQALAGIFTRPEEAVMVRFDSFDESESVSRNHGELFTAIKDFNLELEASIDPKTRQLFYEIITSEDI